MSEAIVGQDQKQEKLNDTVLPASNAGKVYMHAGLYETHKPLRIRNQSNWRASHWILIIFLIIMASLIFVN